MLQHLSSKTYKQSVTCYVNNVCYVVLKSNGEVEGGCYQITDCDGDDYKKLSNQYEGNFYKKCCTTSLFFYAIILCCLT